MPKKALVLNGFAGGINKDSDATDLPAEGRGKDQVVSLKNMLADRGGKVRTRLYTVTAETGFTGGTTIDAKHDLMIFDGKEYHEQGVYKVGKDINWSGAISALKPLSLGHTNAQADSIGIGPSFSNKGLYSVFMGGGASQSNSTNPVFGDVVQTSYNISDYVRTMQDTNNNGLFGESYTQFDQAYALGEYNYLIYNVDMTDSANYTITSDGGGMTQVASSGLQITDGVEHVNTTGDEFFEIDTDSVTMISTSYYKLEFNVSGAFAVSDDLKITLHSGTIGGGDSQVLKEFTITSDGKQSVTFNGGFTTAYKRLRFLIGHGNSVTRAAGSYFEITGMRLYAYGVNSLASETKAMLRDSSTGIIDTYSGADYGTNPFSQSYNVTGGDRISLNKLLDNPGEGEDSALIFRVGYNNLSGSNANGMSGTSLPFDANNKDIYIELNVDPNEVIASTSDFNGINIILNSDGDDFEISDHSGGSTRVYSISQAEINSNSAWRTTGRIKIPSTSYIWSGPNFDPTNVLLVGVTADIENASYDNTTLYDLYELSFATGGALGWTESTVQLSQSDTRNSSESLASNYTTTIDANEKNQLEIEIHEPLTSNYKGNLYFQTVDDTDGVSTNARFLLAEVDKNKGAKKIGSTDWTPWSSNKVAFSFSNIPRESTFELESGYPERTEYVNAIWETAATNGRQVYIGNIHSPGITTPLVFNDTGANKISCALGWERLGFSVGDIITTTGAATAANNSTFKVSDISSTSMTVTTEAGGVVSTLVNETVTCNVGVRDTDRILKTPIGKLYGFSDKNFIDLELGAGNLKVLKTAGDRLLAFSEDTLTIVNVAQDYEYLEATLPGYGVDYNRQVTQVEEGVAFVNSSGVFFFDGNKINNISATLIDSLEFSNASRIGYEPIEKIILVWKGASAAEVFGYSLKTNSWVAEVDAMGIPLTNSVAYKSNMYFVDTSDDLQKISNGSSVRTIELETGRMSCGNLAMQKSFKTLYVTVVNNTGTLTVDWNVDGGSYTDSPSAISGNGRIKINLNAKGKDIQFKFAGTNTHADFEISDIQLIYRDKKVE